jgi:hypothetical protein
MNGLLGVALIAGLWQATSAAGQPLEGQPRFEIGGAAGGMAAVSRGGGLLVAAGPRLSFNLADRTGFELVGDAIAPSESSGLYGLYTIQLRHVMRKGGPSRAAIFVTAGIIGVFEYDRVPERRNERPDGSAVIYRAYTEAELTRPLGFSGGLGMQRVLARYAAFRADAQAMTPFEEVLLIRATLGVSIPIGASYARTE